MLPRLRTLAALIALAGCAGTAPLPAPPTAEPPEAYSLLGEPLRPAPLAPATRDSFEARLARARADHEQSPHHPEAVIWLGRRTAYLGRYREAIAIYSRGIEQHPDYAKLYRHRGHRYISVREFDRAIEDLERAVELIAGAPDETEPDGLPNARNVPTSTTHTNIWYHLGLAYYLRGDYENARRCYVSCLEFCKNPDMLCATTYWLWQCLTRLGSHEEARRVLEPIQSGPDIIENHDYHRLLLLYRGEVRADTLLRSARKAGGVTWATAGYGVASWRLARGERGAGLALLREILKGDAWAAFGHIAAEADLRRLSGRPR